MAELIVKAAWSERYRTSFKMGNIKIKSGYCPDCGNTKPKPLIAGFCQYHYWQSRSKSKSTVTDDPDSENEKVAEAIPVKMKVSKKKQAGLSAIRDLAILVFHRSIKKRDCEDGVGTCCISCGKYYKLDELQAGHYMPSTYSTLKFNELNVHAECVACNCGDINHLVGYRKNLILKVGLDKVEWLESHSLSDTVKWDEDFYKEVISKYK